jgi:ABC-type transport system involved in multi-copper enzyme maturation permease subunit
MRAACLGVLWILGLTFWQAAIGWTTTPTLGDAALFSQRLFMMYTAVQLVGVLFFAALAAANSIIQEKDRRTFVLLLITDLRNHEIVLGKVLGSLLNMALLLASMIPVLAILMLLGGVSLTQVAETVLLLAASGLAAGSWGGLIATWRESSWQALALTILGLVLYLALIQDVAIFAGFVLGGALGGGLLVFLRSRLSQHKLPRFLIWATAVILGLCGGLALWWVLRSWDGFLAWEPTLQVWLNPYRAWLTVVFPEPANESGAIPPALGFAGTMLGWSVILNVWGIVMLRTWNPSGEPIQQREAPGDAAEEEKDRLTAHAAPGKAREVWANPILWREIRTRAYGAWPLLVKLVYVLVVALIGYWALAPIVSGSGMVSGYAPGFGLVPVGVISLLLVSAQAVTAITSERARGALDLLLVTDLTPQEFIFGKLGGILYNTKEFLLPPLILALIYGHYHLLARAPTDHQELLLSRNVEATGCLLGVTVVLLTFAMVLGLHVSLRTDKSRVAIINTLGTVFFLTAGTLVCIYLILINGGRFEYQWLSFIFFIAAGIGGLWWVLSGHRPAAALTIASWACPIGVFYTVVNLVVAKPGTQETADPLIPFVVIVGAFGFTIAAMLVPLVSEFDVALGRTTGGGE